MLPKSPSDWFKLHTVTLIHTNPTTSSPRLNRKIGRRTFKFGQVNKRNAGCQIKFSPNVSYQLNCWPFVSHVDTNN